MSIFSETYSDIRVVEAYTTSHDKRVMQWWYEHCREAFRKIAPSLEGLSEMDLDDLFHNAHVLMWDKMEQCAIFVDDNRVYSRRRDGVALCDNLTGYFVKIVRLKHFEMLRENRMKISLATDGPDDATVYDQLYADSDHEVETDRIVNQTLLSLPKSCLEILTMFYYEHLTLDQILEKRPESNSYDGLKARKSKCMATLKKRIDEKLKKASLR